MKKGKSQIFNEVILRFSEDHISYGHSVEFMFSLKMAVLSDFLIFESWESTDV
jgi:hypothetical protein